jgi:hypothetical protein
MDLDSTSRVIPIVAFVMFCSTLVAAREGAGAGPADSVPWKDVLVSIESSICSGSVEHEGRTFYYANVGSREECVLAGEPSKLDLIVDAAFVDARPLVGSLGFKADLSERLASMTPKERDRAARDTYIEDPRFLRALVPRIEGRMREAGLACDGCPVFPFPQVKTIHYAAFRPYLEAYIWPDEVTDRLDASGNPTGEKRYSFHICAGLNGVGQMENPDPDLLRAGFVVVFGTETIHQRAGEVFRDHTTRSDLARLATDRERTDRLRREVPAAVFTGKSLLKTVCGSLDRFENDLGLRLIECR